MTKVIFLEALKTFTEAAVQDLILPVMQQKEDKVPPAPRAPEAFCMRLPDSGAAKKKSPYVLHQIITGKDVFPTGQHAAASAVVRTICSVYNPDEQEGGLSLLNLMERLRIALLQTGVIGKQFVLDMEAGLESLIYPENVAPFYAGEMISTWKLPVIERIVSNDPKGIWTGGSGRR